MSEDERQSTIHSTMTWKSTENMFKRMSQPVCSNAAFGSKNLFFIDFLFIKVRN